MSPGSRAVLYILHPDATQQQEISALADAYAFLREACEGQEGSPVPATLDDTRGETERDSRAKKIIPERL